MKKKLASVMMVLLMLLNTLVTGGGVAYAEEQIGESPLKTTASFNAPDGGKIDDDVDRSGLLGIAKHFHIFANKATLKADTAGNVAVGNLDAQSNFGTRIKDGKLKLDISYIQNANFIQSSSFVNSDGNRKNKAVFGENVQLTLVDNGNKVAANGSKLDHLNKDEIFQDKNGNKYINFDEEFEKLRKSSDEIAAHPQTPSVEKNFNDENNRYFDVSKVKTTASGTVILTKTDEDGKLLDNVTFDLYKEGNNSPIKSGLKTTNGKITVTDLEKGNYYFKEVATPESYVVDSSPQRFSIKDENLGSRSTIYLDLTKEEIEKDRPIIIKGIDKNGSNIIVNVDTENAQTVNIGAEIKLQYTDGTDRPNHETEDFSDAVILWNFKNRASNQVININRARFQGSILAVGNTVEVGQNVDGCIIADTVNITGGESHRWDFQEKNGNNGKPAELTMVNKLKEVPTKVKFSKKALTEDGEELKGAKIKLTKEDGSLVKEWVTDGSVTEFELKDGKYTFTEVSAPDKYQVATAITFEVKDGKVFVKNVEVSGNTIVMVDKLKEVPTKPEIKKPKTPLPKTGDSSNLSLYVLGLGLSGLGLLLLGIFRRKKVEEN